ncbi:hypothetical protein R8Z50_13830 [Longispora sp. K20-0274]|uniref:hypothetical protein n=1 Tax=Longispora sp. K20-0274 TaxID=3088255 RepID=UPI00399B554B
MTSEPRRIGHRGGNEGFSAGGPAVAGRFVGDDGEFVVTADGPELTLTAPGQAPLALRPADDGSRRAAGLNVTVRFPAPDALVIAQDAAPGTDIHATLKI